MKTNRRFALTTAMVCLVALTLAHGSPARAQTATNLQVASTASPASPATTPVVAKDKAAPGTGAAASKSEKARGLSDQQITRDILTALIHQDLDNAFMRKTVKIVSVNGHVTLEGHVKTEKQKQMLNQAADSVVGAGHVTDQVVVGKPR